MDNPTTSPISTEPFALPVRAAVAFSGFSRTRVFELLKAGALESRMDGAKRLILTSSLKAAVMALPNAPADKAA